MFCPHCGSEIPSGVAFCPTCGSAVSTADPTAPAAPSPAEATPLDQAHAPAAEKPMASVPLEDHSAGSTTVASPAADAAPRRRKTGAIVAAALALALLAGGGVGGFMWWQGEQARIAEEARQKAEEQAAWEREHQRYPAPVQIDCPGLDTTTGTKIPLRVTGTDFEGNKVDETFYTDQAGTGVELMRGDYTFTVPASPIAADGTIYDAAATEEIPLSGTVHDDGTFETQNYVYLSPIDAADVTDEQIEAAYDAAVDGGCENADVLRDAATTRRDEAVEAANSLRFEAASYTVELPERWRDRVTVQVSGDSITVYSAAYPERELATYSVISTEAAINAGDIGTQLLHVDLGNGSSVEIAVPNYPYLIGSSFHQGYVSDETWFTADDSAELLDLQTNGALSQMQAVDAYDNGDNATLLSAGETMRQELIAGVSCREH